MSALDDAVAFAAKRYPHDYGSVAADLANLREELRIGNALTARLSDAAEVSPKELRDLRADSGRWQQVVQWERERGGKALNYYKRHWYIRGITDADGYNLGPFDTPEAAMDAAMQEVSRERN